MDYRRMNCGPDEIQIQFLKPGQRFKLNLAPYCTRIGTLRAINVGNCSVDWHKTEVKKFVVDGRTVLGASAGIHIVAGAHNLTVR